MSETTPNWHTPTPLRSRASRTTRIARGAGAVVALAALLLVARWGVGHGQEKEEAMSEKGKPNRLIEEKSPYLLQHAYNPVDWHPWGDEAIEKARAENKPIFLSVGYSTCHWCHVMERESFENPQIAALINQWFIPIKVDREERPDIDRIYMNAAYALGTQGGWPLSVWLTPDLKPFFAGTYFPPKDMPGRPSFSKVLEAINKTWVSRQEEIEGQADQVTTFIVNSLQVRPDTVVSRVEDILPLAFEQMMNGFDYVNGGFSGAPKFPQPGLAIFYMREWSRRGGTDPLDPVLHTLRRMALGGMYDQLGGGFHRYSTDAQWRVPHFEKMLYDQAQLVWAYLEAYQITKDEFFLNVALDILRYVERDMRHPDGGFYSAEDADSKTESGEIEEGAFYVWTVDEVTEVLGEKRADPFRRHYNVSIRGNVEKGKSVLHSTKTIEETADDLDLDPNQLVKQFAEDRKKLLEVRNERPRPHLDDKVLTSWNGLMISAFARAYQIVPEERYLRAAREAADFIWENSYDEASGTLYRRYRDGETGIPGELTDYAFYVQGLLDLYEAGFDIESLQRAVMLTERQIERFWDTEQGGFFDTADGASTHILARTKDSGDGAEPTGNSVATMNLARIAQMTDRQEFADMAQRTLMLFAAHTVRTPVAMVHMWVAADFLTGKPRQVVIAGEPGAKDTREMLEVVHQRYLPRKILLLADGGDGQEWLIERLEFLKTVRPIDGKATAYVCEDYVCQLPTDDPEMVEKQLGEPLALQSP